jgi:anti-sigma factor RsiW
MNCRDNESLILAERDGALTQPQLAALSDHVAVCPACRKLRADFTAAVGAYETGIAQVPAPDADEAWRDLQVRLNSPAKREKKRPLAPVIWFGAPIAAAAALAFALLPHPPEPVSPSAPLEARAEFVEAGDATASTLVYVDKESGWLVVWAAEAPRETSG